MQAVRPFVLLEAVVWLMLCAGQLVPALPAILLDYLLGPTRLQRPGKDSYAALACICVVEIPQQSAFRRGRRRNEDNGDEQQQRVPACRCRSKLAPIPDQARTAVCCTFFMRLLKLALQAQSSARLPAKPAQAAAASILHSLIMSVCRVLGRCCRQNVTFHAPSRPSSSSRGPSVAKDQDGHRARKSATHTYAEVMLSFSLRGVRTRRNYRNRELRWDHERVAALLFKLQL